MCTQVAHSPAIADSSLTPKPLTISPMKAIKDETRISRYSGLMATRSFFIQRPEDARRHMDLLAKGLKKVALAGWVGGAGCTALAVMVTHFLVNRGPQNNPVPGFQETSGITFVTWFMAIGLLLFSSLYFVCGWALGKQKKWARYASAATFLSKILLCVWLGRGTVAAMIVFLLIASWDFYGLWVLLSKETAQVFQPAQAATKPANLVT